MHLDAKFLHSLLDRKKTYFRDPDMSKMLFHFAGIPVGSILPLLVKTVQEFGLLRQTENGYMN